MTRYQLTLQAEKLRRVSPLRVGQPYAVVTVTGGSREGDILGETEALDTLDPRWCTIIYVDTDPSIYMPITVEILDRQEGRDDRTMAEASFEVTAVYESQVHSQYEEAKGGAIIRATVIESEKGSLTGSARLRFRLLDVKNVESGILGLGRTDPYLEIQKKNFDPDAGVTNWIPAYRGEHIVDNLNPLFREFQVPVEALCYCDPLWPLRIVLYDWQKGGKHRSIGLYETNFQDLMAKVATGGNADRECGLEILKENSEKTVALLIILMAENLD